MINGIKSFRQRASALETTRFTPNQTNFSDFMGKYGSITVGAPGDWMSEFWTGRRSQGNFSAVAPIDNEGPGIIRMGFAGAGGVGGIGVFTGQCCLFGSFKSYYTVQKVRINNLALVGNVYAYFSGFIEPQITEPVDGAYFLHNNTTGSWQCKTASNSVTTTVTTSVPVVVGQWYILEIFVNEMATEVVFKIDGSTVATINSNVPTGNGRATGMGLAMRRTAVAVTASVDTDRFYFE